MKERKRSHREREIARVRERKRKIFIFMNIDLFIIYYFIKRLYLYLFSLILMIKFDNLNKVFVTYLYRVHIFGGNMAYNMTDNISAIDRVVATPQYWLSYRS